MDAGGRSTPVGDTVDDAAELKRAQIRMAIRSIERKASKAGDLLASAEDLSKFSGTVFRNVDVDSTGYVEFGELRVCLEEICALFGLEKPSQEDVETSMKDLDKDMNGKVSSDEFEALIKQVLEGMQELHQADVAQAPAADMAEMAEGEEEEEEEDEAPATAAAAADAGAHSVKTHTAEGAHVTTVAEGAHATAAAPANDVPPST